jgi:5-bromo-4-chloroindolyl phosphate hydrolysis protein
MGRGTPTLIAGLAGAATLPILAVGFHVPLWLAVIVTLIGAAGVWLITSALRPGSGIGEEEAIEARSEVVRELVADASAAIDRLTKIQKTVRDDEMRKEIDDLVATGSRVLKDVRANPQRAMAVRRLLTFYLPNAAGLAEGWRALETRTRPSPERITQTREVMKGLGEVFHRFADDVAGPELQTLDLDLKVVKDALSADLEKTS